MSNCGCMNIVRIPPMSYILLGYTTVFKHLCRYVYFFIKIIFDFIHYLQYNIYFFNKSIFINHLLLNLAVLRRNCSDSLEVQ